MARRKKIPPYKAGDQCFFVNMYNKIRFGAIKSTHESTDGVLHYQIVDTTDYRFNVVEHKYCADTDKLLKGVKRPAKR